VVITGVFQQLIDYESSLIPGCEEKNLSEHLQQSQIKDFTRRKLSAADLISVSDHLGGCETCRSQVERALDGDATYFALRSAVFGEAVTIPSSVDQMHLSFEQTARYIDGELGGEERQFVEDHLSGCEQCDLSVNDLRAFKNQVASELDREYQPSLAHAGTGSRWQSFVSMLPSFLPRSPQLLAGTAVAALVLVLSGWIVWRTMQMSDEKQEIVITHPSPSPVVAPSISPSPIQEGAAEMVIAQINDGENQVILDREGKLSGLDHLPPDYQQKVKEALTRQQLDRSPLLSGLTRRGSPLMSGGDSQGKQFSIIEPVGKVLQSDRPIFRWSLLEGATGYVVEVYDDQFNPVATSPQLTNNSWTARTPLKRGKIYSWQVKAIKDGQEFISPRPPAPQAKFRILDQARANELTQARRAYASSHLTLAVLYSQIGLLDEAERELRALQEANPDSAIVRQLLANVRAMRRSFRT
jgi:anti-sigma factor RsiW